MGRYRKWGKFLRPRKSDHQLEEVVTLAGKYHIHVGLLLNQYSPQRRCEGWTSKDGYCPPDGFACYDGSTCLSSADCNFKKDCPGGEDEFHCNCDFESPCDWMESFLVEEMGWRVGSGLSVSSTLPEYDYTEDTEQESGPQCKLRFASHVSANLTGSLLLHLYVDNTSIEIWATEGQNVTVLDQWEEEEIELGKFEQGFRLGFEYIQGESVIGHVALDDITMDSCSPDLPTLACGEKEYTCLNTLCVPWDHLCDLSPDCFFGEDEGEKCTKMPPGARCDFEDEMCGWYELDTVDQFDWSRQNGTSNTGPAFDNTFYHEHGFAVQRGGATHNAIEHFCLAGCELLEPKVPPPVKEVWQCNSSVFEECKGDEQVRFFYHVYGYHIGRLTLLAVHNGTEEELWSLSQQEEEGRWLQSSVILPRITSCTVRLYGIPTPSVVPRRWSESNEGRREWLTINEWNKLPGQLVKAQTVEAFKAGLLAAQPYDTPVGVVREFYLQFAANITEDWVEGDIAVDDVSLSPQCFGLSKSNTI
ncbi:hypothetical protein Bbelb_431230 [Branchiostoma belcheri]|nr:hypothetical protein Bbelb_431230 [Branchiostoma belcheri]